MRIYFYSGRVSGRGGTEVVLKSVVRAFVEKCHEVKLLLSSISENNKWEEGLPVIHLDNLSINNDLWINSNDIDIDENKYPRKRKEVMLLRAC